MQRFTISLEDKLAEEFDALIAARGYATRSEAVRDLLRAELERTHQQRVVDGDCIAALSYVFNHHERDLAERITGFQHDHHGLTVATMHAHLDHDHCLEAVILKGRAEEVRHFTDALCAERGVHHGHVNLISVDAHEPHARRRAAAKAVRDSGQRHGMSGHAHPHPHAHLHVKPST